MSLFLSSSRTGPAVVALWRVNSYFSIPCPSGQAGMKSKQKSGQNEPSAGRFDGPRTCSVQLKQKLGSLLFNLFMRHGVVPPKEKKCEENRSSEREENFPVRRPTGGVWKFLAERIRFLAFYPSAAAARYIGLFTFFCCRKKVKARPAGGQHH